MPRQPSSLSRMTAELAPSAPLLACVIVDHNHPEAVADQLKRLLPEAASSSAPVDVIVVQNGERKLDPAAFPGATIIACDNRGYGAAVNLGVRQTRARSILALNAA